MLKKNHSAYLRKIIFFRKKNKALDHHPDSRYTKSTLIEGKDALKKKPGMGRSKQRMELVEIGNRVKIAYSKVVDIKDVVDVVPFIFRSTKGYTVWTKTKETIETVSGYEAAAGNKVQEIKQNGEYYTLFIKVS
jgi:hypothetical protein